MVDKLQGTWREQWSTPQIQYMLSYIWHQHCRIVAFSRCLVIKCRMASLKVVGVDILSDSSPCFPDVVVLCQIGFLILEAAEPALNHDVVCPAAFSIHTLADTVFLYKVNVLLTCKLTTLIWIQDLRFCHFESFFQGTDNHSGIKCVIHFPADNTRLYQSITAVRYRNPRLIGIYVMSIDHAWFGLSMTALRRRYGHTFACCIRLERFIFG